MHFLALLIIAIVVAIIWYPRHIAKRRNAALVQAPLAGVDEVARLLDEGADVDASDDNGYTALLVAASRGDLDLVRLLLDRDATVNATNRLGHTALMLASTEGHSEVAQMLLDRGAGVNMRNQLDKTALGCTTGKIQHREVKEVLLQYGAKE
jgi:ankyrin repeat protein